MESQKIIIKCAAQGGAKIPSYQTAGSSGADVCALVDAPIVIQPGDFVLVPTGLYVEIPAGFEIQVRPRSGLAAKYGVTCLNTPGTIDADYRGEIKIILINHGKQPFTVSSGDRIAQLVAASVVSAQFLPSSSLDNTDRGTGGFGSTGISS